MPTWFSVELGLFDPEFSVVLAARNYWECGLLTREYRSLNGGKSELFRWAVDYRSIGAIGISIVQ